jgi:hypothetical protein
MCLPDSRSIRRGITAVSVLWRITGTDTTTLPTSQAALGDASSMAAPRVPSRPVRAEQFRKEPLGAPCFPRAPRARQRHIVPCAGSRLQYERSDNGNKIESAGRQPACADPRSGGPALNRRHAGRGKLCLLQSPTGARRVPQGLHEALCQALEVGGHGTRLRRSAQYRQVRDERGRRSRHLERPATVAVGR